MNGHPRRTRRRRAVPHGSRQLDPRRDARAGARGGRGGAGGAAGGGGAALAGGGGAGTFHAAESPTGGAVASAVMSTRASGRRSTCATTAIARPALVKPVSRTSSPYWG